MLARDVILAVVSDRSRPICAPCLSKLTGLSSVRVVDGWRDLALLRSDYHVRRGRCADCRETGELLHRVSDPVGDPRCEICAEFIRPGQKAMFKDVENTGLVRVHVRCVAEARISRLKSLPGA